VSEHLLEVRNLKTYFGTPRGVVRAVDGVSLHIDAGETLAVVGESGCGKSVTALSIMQLLPSPPAYFEAGEIIFAGADLLRKTSADMRAIRGNEIGMIYQEPMTSLNPVFTVGDQIVEAIELHQGLRGKSALSRAKSMLDLVGVPDGDRRLSEYPHQLSGGMRQRIVIAMALCGNLRLLIADEPTTALDVTIQAQILQLIRDLQRDLGMALMLITHDLGVVAEMADRVAVMYMGRIVEEASVRELYRQPLHPYTTGLLGCIPRVHEMRPRLAVIPGSVQQVIGEHRGCRFAQRCSCAEDVCMVSEPELRAVGGRTLACHRDLSSGLLEPVEVIK